MSLKRVMLASALHWLKHFHVDGLHIYLPTLPLSLITRNTIIVNLDDPCTLTVIGWLRDRTVLHASVDILSLYWVYKAKRYACQTAKCILSMVTYFDNCCR